MFLKTAVTSSWQSSKYQPEGVDMELLFEHKNKLYLWRTIYVKLVKSHQQHSSHYINNFIDIRINLIELENTMNY